MKLRFSILSVGIALLTVTSLVNAQDLQRGMEAYYNQDVETARQELLPLSNSGNQKAKAIIGRMQMKGLAFPVNVQEGLRLCTEAANQGEALGELCIGNAYYDGIGVKQDYAESVKWYQKAADQELDRAQDYLGEAYYFGKGVTQDYPKALKWFQKAADKGNKHAIQFLKENEFPGAILESATQTHNKEIVITITGLSERTNIYGRPVCQLKYNVTNLSTGTIYYILADIDGWDDRGEMLEEMLGSSLGNVRGMTPVPIALETTQNFDGGGQFETRCEYLADIQFTNINPAYCNIRMLPEGVNCNDLISLRSNVDQITIIDTK